MTQFNTNDRIRDFADWWWGTDDSELSRQQFSDVLRKHFGDLKRGLTPEEVEAIVKGECAELGSRYDGPGHPNCDIGVEGAVRRVLTRHAVAGGEKQADSSYELLRKRTEDAEARAEAAEIERDRQAEFATAAIHAKRTAEKELAEAHARIAELEACVKNYHAAQDGEQSLWDDLSRANGTIVAQAHEIRELKEARR